MTGKGAQKCFEQHLGLATRNLRRLRGQRREVCTNMDVEAKCLIACNVSFARKPEQETICRVSTGIASRTLCWSRRAAYRRRKRISDALDQVCCQTFVQFRHAEKSTVFRVCAVWNISAENKSNNIYWRTQFEGRWVGDMEFTLVFAFGTTSPFSEKVHQVEACSRNIYGRTCIPL